MNRIIQRRLSCGFGPLLLTAFAMLPLVQSVGCAGNSSKNAEQSFLSPEASFKTARQMLISRDYTGFVRCFTDDGLNELAGGMRLLAGFASAMGSGPRAEPGAVELSKNIKDLIDKYVPAGATEINLNLNAPAGELRAAILDAGRAISDREAFLVEMLKILATAQQVRTSKPPLQDAKLVDIKVGSDTATATISEGIVSPGPTPIRFRLVNGQWKIDELGQVGVSTSDKP